MSWTKTSGGIYLPGPTPTSVNAIWLSTYAGGVPCYEICGVKQASGLPTPAAWQTVDLTPLFVGIVAPVIAVEFGGFIIITSGSQTDDADLCIAFQQSGAGTNPLNYAFQGISPGPGMGTVALGERTNYGDAAVAVTPVANVGQNCIDFAWLRGDAGLGQFPAGVLPAYPQGATYEVTLDIRKVYT